MFWSHGHCGIWFQTVVFGIKGIVQLGGLSSLGEIILKTADGDGRMGGGGVCVEDWGWEGM